MKVTCCPPPPAPDGVVAQKEVSQKEGKQVAHRRRYTLTRPRGFVHRAEAPTPTGLVRKRTEHGADESSLYRLHSFPRNLKPFQKIKLTLCFTCFEM